MNKWILISIITAALSIIFWSCSDDNNSNPENNAPSCTFISPSDSTVFGVGENITVKVDADDTDGYIYEIRFYLDDQPYSSDKDFPYTFTFSSTGLGMGKHTVKAETRDDNGSVNAKTLIFGIGPVAPVNLQLQQNNVHTFTLTWEYDSSGIDGFNIERKIDDGELIKISTTAENTYIDRFVSKESYGSVTYQVSAYTGIYSSSLLCGTSNIIFSLPSELSTVFKSPTEVELTWKDNSIGEEKFVIERKLESEEVYTKIGEVAGDDTGIKNWTDFDVVYDAVYDYRIYGIKGLNMSGYTENKYINIVPAPLNLSASIINSTSIKIFWNDNTSIENGFLIDRKIGTSGTWNINYAETGADISNWTDTGLITGTVYYYRLRAYFSSYISNYTNEVSAVPQVIPDRMVLVPPGSFFMGSTENEDEQPVHNVTITKSFYLGKYEVTQKEWSDIMGSNPATIFGTGDNYPVYHINWYSILKYCNLRSIAEGLTPCYTINSSIDPGDWGIVPTDYYESPWDEVKCNFNTNGYRLPTEAEWEYAARYNDDRLYPWGNENPSAGLCNYNSFLGETQEVGSYPAGNSKLELCDMGGNVWEWCWDGFDYYGTQSLTDPSGPDTPRELRVLRGGEWPFKEDALRCAYRNFFVPFVQSFSGFRVARSLD